MTKVHDPKTILRQLRQILVAGRLPVGFFIGAGCPTSIRVDGADGTKEALIPDVSALTKYVLSELEGDVLISGASKKLTALLAQDNEHTPTIERILSRARALHDVAGQGEVRGLSYLELSALDKAICKSISKRVSRDLPGASPYHALAKFAGASRTSPVAIFTTNYDLLMEQAFERLRIPYFDGFIGSHYPFFDQRAVESDPVPTRWVRFWKLHGSINWRYEKARHCVIRSVDDTEEQMIHPSHLKYDASRRMPYLVMIDRMRAFLRDTPGPAALFISGYSFGDQHLNEVILEGLQANPNSACYALLYGKLENYPSARDLARIASNLTLVAEDRGMIRGTDGYWEVHGGDELLSLGSSFALADPDKSSVGDDEPKRFKSSLGDFASFAELLDELATMAGGQYG